MKKVFLSLSLLVMVFSYVFAPLTYADSYSFYKKSGINLSRDVMDYDYSPMYPTSEGETYTFDMDEGTELVQFIGFGYVGAAESKSYENLTESLVDNGSGSYSYTLDDMRSGDVNFYAAMAHDIKIKFYSKRNDSNPSEVIVKYNDEDVSINTGNVESFEKEKDYPNLGYGFGYYFDKWIGYGCGEERDIDGMDSLSYAYLQDKVKESESYLFEVKPKYDYSTGYYINYYSGEDLLTSGYVRHGTNYTISSNDEGATSSWGDFKGWNTNSGANVVISSIDSVDTGTNLYAIFSKVITITFDANGNVLSNTSATCEIFSEDGTCEVTVPTITPATWKTVQGFSTGADIHDNLESGTTIEVGLDDDGKTYYAQSKREGGEWLNAKFDGNGGTVSFTDADQCTTLETWNAEKPSCIVDAPTYTVPEGKAFVGFNTSASATTNNEAYNSSTKKLTITEDTDGATWYLITAAPSPAAGGGTSVLNKTAPDTHNSVDTEKADKKETPAEDKAEDKTQTTEESNNETSDTTTSEESSSSVINEVSESAVTTENKTTYTDEIIDAYTWAYQRDVTTMETLDKALPDDIMIRGHMAKVVVNYMVNVLGRPMPKEIPVQCSWNDSESDWESAEIKDYAKKACAFGVMGIDMDKFLPKKRLSRAEFGTILSRILWGDKYNNGGVDVPFYIEHLTALKEEGLMNDIVNADIRNEQREWIWVALRRTENTKK